MAHFSFFVRLGNSFGFRSVVREAFLGAVYRSHGFITGRQSTRVSPSVRAELRLGFDYKRECNRTTRFFIRLTKRAFVVCVSFGLLLGRHGATQIDHEADGGW